MKGCELARFVLKLQEELLVEDEGHTADLLHFRLRCGVAVHKVGRDGDGQLASKLLPSETWSQDDAEKGTGERRGRNHEEERNKKKKKKKDLFTNYFLYDFLIS